MDIEAKHRGEESIGLETGRRALAVVTAAALLMPNVQLAFAENASNVGAADGPEFDHQAEVDAARVKLAAAQAALEAAQNDVDAKQAAYHAAQEDLTYKQEALNAANQTFKSLQDQKDRIACSRKAKAWGSGSGAGRGLFVALGAADAGKDAGRPFRRVESMDFCCYKMGGAASCCQSCPSASGC